MYEITWKMNPETTVMIAGRWHDCIVTSQNYGALFVSNNKTR